MGTRLLLLIGFAALVAGAVLLTVPDRAAAQEGLTGPTQGNPYSIRNRARPDYDPEGLPVGSFLVFPSFELGEVYDTNVFRTETNESDDFITTYAPSINVVSDWNNHAVAFGATANGGVFADNSDENYFDYGFFAAGRLDVRRSTRVGAFVSWDHLHEDRGSPEDVNGDEPTEFDEFRTGVNATTTQGRFTIFLGGEYSHLTFENVTAGGGTMMVNNADRDQSAVEGTARVDYNVSPGYAIFVLGSYIDVSYDNTPDDAGRVRDNNGWRADAGVAFEITETFSGDVYGGYIQRYYDDPTFADTDSFDLGGDIYWSITPLTTARLVLERSFVETTQAGASSILETSGVIEVEHELLRNVILGANVGLTNFDYEGITREDDVWGFGVDGVYLINRNFYAGGRAQYTNRDSNAPTESFEDIEVGVFVGAQM